MSTAPAAGAPAAGGAPAGGAPAGGAPAGAAAAAPVVAHDPIPYAYSTGNAFAAFAKFNGKNYFAWRRKMETQLRALGQWEVVTGTITAPVPADPRNPTADETRLLDAWTLRAARAYAEIALRVDDDYGEVIAAVTDPYAAWTTLEASYGSQQSGIQSVVNAELTLAKWDADKPINDHRDHMKTLRTRLADAGLGISNLQFYNYFVNSLPAEFDMVVAVHNPAPDYSVDTLCERFRAIELRKGLRSAKVGGPIDDAIAMLAKHRLPKSTSGPSVDKRASSGRQDSKRSKQTCFKCGKSWFRGHRCAEKREASDAKRGSTSTDKAKPPKPAGGTLLCLTDAQQAAYFTARAGKYMPYYIDSGATSHYVNEVDSLHDYVEFDVPKSIKTAEADNIYAVGSGTLRFTAKIDGIDRDGELKDVYFIPDIQTRLISLGKLFSQGWYPRLDRYGISVYDHKNELAFRAPMDHNIYTAMLHAKPPETSYYVWDVPDDELEEPLYALFTSGQNDPPSLYDWHRRMGHPQTISIVKMAQYAVNGMNISSATGKGMRLDDCPTCVLTKSVRLPFSGTRTRASEILQLVHGDLLGPLPIESIGKHKYVFVLCDDYSRAGWMLPLKDKSDAPVAFERWANMMTNGTNMTIKTVMFDNARELIAGKMRELCNARGIRIISSVPYSPSSNGVAERLIGVATRGIRAMLLDAKLPPRFWAEAMSTFMYLRNRTPTMSNNGKTPFEVFYGMKPNVDHIRRFGCITKVTLPAEKLKKLDNRAVMGYLLGYKYEGGYRVWIPNQGVKEVRDVTFYEDTAPVEPDDAGDYHESPTSDIWWPTYDLPQTPPSQMPRASETPQTMPIEPSRDADSQSEKIIIRIPGRYHPRAPRQRSPSKAPVETQEELTEMTAENDDAAPKYVGRIHHFPERSSRSGLVRNAGGEVAMRAAGDEGAMIAYTAFEVAEPAFIPTPATPNPMSIHEAHNAPDANDWMAAMDDEINNMRRLAVFKEVPKPKNRNIITPKWVFRRKFEDGTLVKHKARLVARGFTQVSGIDYHDAYLYAPVVRLETFRALISIAALFGLELRQFDVSAAYLHGEIDEEVYMEPPPGYGSSDSVWLLQKGLYGLKQAGRIWHERLKADMEELGFVQCPRDHAVFRIGTWRKDDWAVCAFWVDDETGVGSPHQLQRVSAMFKNKYGISGEGELTWTLGIGVRRDRDARIVSLSQEAYIDNLIERFDLQNATTVTTPLAPGVILSKEQCPAKPHENSHYRELIGSLQYASLATRPDITFAVNKLAQFLTNPGAAHMEAAMRVLRYLKGTKHWTLNLGGRVADVAGYTDSDWGADRDDRKSIGAYVFRIGDAAISWKTKKQSSVALSSVEAEYMAMCQAAKEAVWLTGLLTDLGIELRSPLIIFGDSQGALALAQNPVFHPRSKHIAIQYHYTRELIQTNQIIVQYVPTKAMIADALTKALPRPQHVIFAQMMGVSARN